MIKQGKAVRYFPLLLLSLPVLLYLRLVWPAISDGLPFFYREDEAHHFNRVVRMVQEQRFDPQYFHKPSLHFYLRMPVVAASFLWEKHRGRAQSLSDIVTYDPFGVADYAFSASHPAMLKWNRTFSAGLNVLLILFTFLIARFISRSNFAALCASLLTAVSPDLIENSAIVGVDTLMALMCMITVYSALRLHRRFSTGLLLLCGFAAGLAISSKYNAAPVALLPLTVCFLRQRLTISSLLLSVLGPLLGFLAGSPYIIFSIPLFLEHLGYEIWHYRVAGHAGNMAEPGLPQVAFYSRWIAQHALGQTAAWAGVAGAALLVFSRRSVNLVFLTFPILFFLLMIAQRANFTRNMLALIPCLAVCAALFCDWLVRAGFRRNLRRLARPIMTLILCLPPFFLSLQEQEAKPAFVDSRLEAARWLEAHASRDTDTAIAGQLQFPVHVYRIPGVSRVDGRNMDFLELFLNGFDLIVLGKGGFAEAEQMPFLRLEAEFDGTGLERIVRNPAVRIYRFVHGSELEQAASQYLASGPYPALKFRIAADGSSVCYRGNLIRQSNPSEGHCWLQRRIEQIEIEVALERSRGAGAVYMEVMSPWPDQKLQVGIPGARGEISFSPEEAGRWKTFRLALPPRLPSGASTMKTTLARVHSPFELGLSRDKRRLGVAIRNLRIE